MDATIGTESGMSWADIVEEDWASKPLDDNNDDESFDDSAPCSPSIPTSGSPLPSTTQRSWANVVGKNDNAKTVKYHSTAELSPTVSSTSPTTATHSNEKIKTEPNDAIQIAQWHSYAKTLQEEDAAERAALLEKARANPVSLPSDAAAMEQVQGLGASRWADAPPTSPPQRQQQYDRYNNRDYDDRGYNHRGNRTDDDQYNRYGHRNRNGDYGNHGYDKRYHNSGGDWSSHSDRTSRSWPRGENVEINNLAGSAKSKWASDEPSSVRSKWATLPESTTEKQHDNSHPSEPSPTTAIQENSLKDEIPAEQSGGSTEESAPASDTKDEAPAAQSGESTEETATASNWDTKDEAPAEQSWGTTEETVPAEQSWGTANESAPANESWGTTEETAPAEQSWGTANESVPAEQSWGTTEESVPAEQSWGTANESAPANEETAPANESWGTTEESAPAEQLWGTANESASQWGTKEESSERNAATSKPAETVHITSWRDVIPATVDESSEPGLANQAWKLAAAAAPSRTRKTSLTPSSTHSQSIVSNIPTTTTDDQTSTSIQDQSTSATMNGTNDSEPATESWPATENKVSDSWTATETTTASDSWTAPENTTTSDSWTATENKALDSWTAPENTTTSDSWTAAETTTASDSWTKTENTTAPENTTTSNSWTATDNTTAPTTTSESWATTSWKASEINGTTDTTQPQKLDDQAAANPWNQFATEAMSRHTPVPIAHLHSRKEQQP